MFATMFTPEFLGFLGILGGAFVAMGKGIQWYVLRIDAKNQKAMEAESALRKVIENSFESRIKSLEIEIGVQREIIRVMNIEKQVFLRRIYQLEAYIQFSKLSVPVMEGWPP